MNQCAPWLFNNAFAHSAKNAVYYALKVNNLIDFQATLFHIAISSFPKPLGCEIETTYCTLYSDPELGPVVIFTIYRLARQ